jgi:hypothetical protein
MRAFPWRRCAPILVLLAVMQLASVKAAERASSKPKGGDKEAVEFFEAVRSGAVEARFIPRDSRKAMVWIENKTDKPVSIRMPLGFAASPVLAQFGDPLFGDGDAAPQRVGAPGNAFPNMDFGGPFGGPGGGRGADPFGGPGIFNVPAGKTIKTRVPCVCLEHGKPNPKPRVRYEILPLENVNDRPEMAELLAALGSGRYSQRVVQAATWHLTNDMTWEQLDAKRIKHSITGRQERWFHPAEIAAAKKLFAALPSVKAKEKLGDSMSDSLAER